MFLEGYPMQSSYTLGENIFCKAGLSHLLVGDSITHLAWENCRRYDAAELDYFVPKVYQLRFILPSFISIKLSMV